MRSNQSTDTPQSSLPSAGLPSNLQKTSTLSGQLPATEQLNGRAYSRLGYHWRVASPADWSYLQTFQCLNGPDASTNKRLRRQFGDLSRWEIRSSTTDAGRIQIGEIDLDSLWVGHSAGFKQAIASFPVPSSLGHVAKMSVIRNRLKQNGVAVLCLGALNGFEGLLVKQTNETARVICTDVVRPESPPYHEITVVSHQELTRTFQPSSFDVIYSSHTLEHVYSDLGVLFADLYSLLKPGGTFISALPCETNPNNPVSNRMLDVIRRNSPFSYLTVSPAHPWKTDVFDIHDRLEAVGFKDIRFYPTEDALNRLSQVAWPDVGAGPVRPGSPTQHVPHRTQRFLVRILATRDLFEAFVTLYYAGASRSVHREKHFDIEILFTAEK
ncbi:MAG TPA: methyltransferase domain-containing protein [Verrucomicrobiae bacterium]|nr:methyltransferase domain-containing protein [Verrucomicrobiae bacterium]